MKRILLAFTFLTLIFATKLKGQTHDEIGLFSCGPLATEVTFYVRCPQLPAMVYLARGSDSQLFGKLYLTTKASAFVSVLEIKECDTVPCRPLGRFERYKGKILYEPLFIVVNPRAGLRFRPVSWADVGAGGSLPLVYCPESYCGAAPMLVIGFWTDARIEVEVAKDRKWGIALSLTSIPPQQGRTPRWTVLSEFSGYKGNGQPWPNNINRDPKHVLWIELGLFTEKR